jgi:hypothetical protein
VAVAATENTFTVGVLATSVSLPQAPKVMLKFSDRLSARFTMDSGSHPLQALDVALSSTRQ